MYYSCVNDKKLSFWIDISYKIILLDMGVSCKDIVRDYKVSDSFFVSIKDYQRVTKGLILWQFRPENTGKQNSMVCSRIYPSPAWKM